MRSVLLTTGILLATSPIAVGQPPPDGIRASEANLIDAHVFARLREIGATPSGLSTDTEFLRRLSLTTIGQLPSADDVRAFVADKRPDKRARKIEDLLSHPLHADMWANCFDELTGNSTSTIAAADEEKPQLAQLWHDWLRDRFARNTPYDELARSIITATSRDDSTTLEDWINTEVAMALAVREGKDAPYAGRKSLDLFWRRTEIDGEYPAHEYAERVASRFMGIRINCARCHDHPFDRWVQDDYRAFVRIFEQVRYGMSPALRSAIADRLEARRQSVASGESPGPALPRLAEVYLTQVTSTADEPAPSPLGGPQLDRLLSDYRVAFLEWLTDPQNEYFSRNFTNRVWAHYFGRGLVEPLDGLSNSDTDEYRDLLDDLAARFAESGYNIRELESLILGSTTWQLSSRPSEGGRDDRIPFSRVYVRLPPAEVVIEMWRQATGIENEDSGDPLNGRRAIEVGIDRLSDSRWYPLLKQFGKIDRTETCDCTERGRPSIRQALMLMSDPRLLADMSQGALATLLASDMTDDQLIDELFLRTLSRLPTDAERMAVLRACSMDDRSAAFEDVLWSLLNTQEFITIH